MKRAVKNFSIYEQALNLAAARKPQNLGQVAIISRRDFEERATFLFRAQTPVLEYVSLMIENALLLRANRTGRVYVGFEKLSRMEAVADRYLRIADLCERIYVFGEPDWMPPRHPNMRVMEVREEDRLAREWFLIAESSTLRAALVGLDEDGFEARAMEELNYSALKSSDPGIITQLASSIEGLIDTSMAA